MVDKEEVGTKATGLKDKEEEEEEDPLVIDEEKPVTEIQDAEVEDNEDDNEKEFEPTVDMIMNEFDDERTIEEEETMTQEDEAEELNALKDEQDIPIEELLKMYGYNKDVSKDSSAAAVEENTNHDATKTDSEPEEISVETEKNESEVVEERDGDLVIGQGEKRGPGTPPPSKKPRSELAKFYEATVEGRSLRSSAGTGQEEEEEESGEEEEEPDKDSFPSWKKTIMIGPSYQASVPGGTTSYDDSPPYENEDKQLWDPTRLAEEVSKEYLAKAAETVPGSLGACGGVNGIPLGSHIRDDEQALLLLLQCGYSVEEALRRKRMNAVPPADTMSLWSEEECRAFETGLRVYGKDFHSIQSQKVGTRSVGELVQFYYLWKKTERHDVFANSFRIEKKKYTLHPGTTDYMERFIDEQEGSRDRSASPNYHSLIYGKKSEKELSSNGAESRGLDVEGEDSMPGPEEAGGRTELDT